MRTDNRKSNFVLSHFIDFVFKTFLQSYILDCTRFKHAVYLKLGEVEAEDTINAGR
jgi:hypothetical protein